LESFRLNPGRSPSWARCIEKFAAVGIVLDRVLLDGGRLVACKGPDGHHNIVLRMGSAWLACMRAHCVVSVDAVAVRVVARTAARLSIYRPEDGAVLAWTL
jgi:hypothetical protein